MIRRPEDWPARLHLFFEEIRTQPFQWGERDCALTACDWIAILVGIDPAAELRGAYRTAIGAGRVMKPRGGLEQIARDACVAHGWQEVGASFARRGDVVLMDFPTGPALGICDGARSAFVGRDGLQLMRTLDCRLAWRIA